ncbi:MAG: hypothetical protein JXL80_03995 [Planctomycetes bacterium]|nr:hypothetical protein [Planctomycetota bacterium]
MASLHGDSQGCSIDASTPVGERQQAEQGGPTLYCPWCAYNLTGLEEMGMRECPECGKVVPFDTLRGKMRLCLDMSSHTYWQVVRHFIPSRRWYRELRRPSYYSVRVPGMDRSYLLVVAVLFGLAAAVSVGIAAFDIGAAVIVSVMTIGYPIGLVASHAIMGQWSRWLLNRVNHPDAQEATRRIMLLAATQYLLMAVASVLFATGMAVGIVGDNTASQVIATFAVFVAGILHLNNCTIWFQIYRWAWALETRYFEVDRFSRLLAHLNPSALLVMLPLMLLIFALALAGFR